MLRAPSSDAKGGRRTFTCSNGSLRATSGLLTCRTHSGAAPSTGRVLVRFSRRDIWRPSCETQTNDRILEPHFHFEPSTSILSVEDPKLIFYLKNLIWRAFTRQVGFRTDYFIGKYDFALSFAGVDRDYARRLCEILTEREIATFYDENEQHRIIARNIEDYLAPIYRSEARYVVVFLSPDYPSRIWTKFESEQFKERFGEDAVIPIRFTTAKPGFFSDEQKYGGLSFDPAANTETQLEEIARILSKRLMEDRGEDVSEADVSSEPKML